MNPRKGGPLRVMSSVTLLVLTDPSYVLMSNDWRTLLDSVDACHADNECAPFLSWMASRLGACATSTISVSENTTPRMVSPYAWKS